LDDLVVQFVAAVLDGVELVAQRDPLLRGGGVDLREELDAFDEVVGLLAEVLKEVGALGLAADSHVVPPVCVWWRSAVLRPTPIVR